MSLTGECVDNPQTALGCVGSGRPGEGPGFPVPDPLRSRRQSFYAQAADLVRVGSHPCLRETVARTTFDGERQ